MAIAGGSSVAASISHRVANIGAGMILMILLVGVSKRVVKVTMVSGAFEPLVVLFGMFRIELFVEPRVTLAGAELADVIAV